MNWRTVALIQDRRRVLVVPVNISPLKRYLLAVQLKSRNGCLYRHLPFPAFGDELLPEVRARIGPVTDIRVSKISIS